MTHCLERYEITPFCVIAFSRKKDFFCESSSFIKPWKDLETMETMETMENVERFQLLHNYINFSFFPLSAPVTAIYSYMLVNLKQS